MKKTVSLMLSLLMIMSVFAVSFQSYAAEYTPASDSQSMLTLVNNFRTGSDAWYWNEGNSTKTTYKANELAAYKYDVNLEAIAKIRAKELAESFSHTRPDGTLCFTCTAKDANGKEVKTYGENISAGFGLTYDGAYDIWLETNEKYEGQGHRRNMLSPKFVAIGIAGFKADDGKTYWVQEFGYTLSAQEKSAPEDATTPEKKPAPAPVVVVSKKSNTLTVKAKKATVKFKKLKKKSQTIALKKAMTVSKAQGKVTFQKAKGNKKITVAKNGKITVKKGLKKGTYKVKIKVMAAGNSAYNAKTKTVTVTIKVK
jgi:uncharacterized protein YkwD